MKGLQQRRWEVWNFVGAACLCLLCPLVAHPQGEDVYAEGKAALQKGDCTAAAKLFESAEAKLPGKTDALLYTGKCYGQLQRFGDAENALRRFTANDPDSAEGLYLLGFILHRENKPAESLAIYTKAAAITPPTAEDLKIVALNYALLKDYADAIHWLERAVQMDPKNKDAWYYLGRAYYTESLPQKARDAFQQVLVIDARDSRAENHLGLLSESEGKVDAAIDSYRKAIEWDAASARPSEQPYLNLGNLLLSQDRLDDAIPLLEKSVALAPANGQAHLKLGLAYWRKGRMEDARTHLEEAVRLDPEDAPSHYQLGRYYAQINKADAAKKEFDRVAELQGHSNQVQPPANQPPH